MRDFPNRDRKKVAPSVPKNDVQETRHSNTLRTRGQMPDEDDDDVGKSLYISF